MTFRSFAPVLRAASELQRVALAVLPHGGQSAARRNAWAAMAHDATQARARREVARAVADARSRSLSSSFATR